MKLFPRAKPEPIIGWNPLPPRLPPIWIDTVVIDDDPDPDRELHRTVCTLPDEEIERIANAVALALRKEIL